jgi:hypothetical protein
LIMNITIKTIPHRNQRYDTVGDWYFDGKGNLTILVSEMKCRRYEILVGLHEWIEAELCRERGIDEAEVTTFDLAFEGRRALGNTDEPGDDKMAPYYNEHQFATCVERLMALELGVDWKEYDEKVSSL